MIRHKSLLVFILIILSPSIYPVTFHHVGVNDGLSSRRVYRIKKCPDGFIWAFTDLGVDRYDGNEIRHYTLNRNAGRYGLTPAALAHDAAGTLRASLENGQIYCYNKLTDAFELETDLAQIHPEPISLNDICFDNENNLWICSSSGIFHFDPETKQVTPAGMGNEAVNCIIPLYDGSYAAGTDTHLFRLWKDETTNTFSTVKRIGFPVKTRIESLFSAEGKLFAGTFSNGIFMMDIAGGHISSFDKFIPPVPVSSFASTGDNTILVGTDGSGVYLLNMADEGLIGHYLADGDNSNSLNSNTVSDIIVDEDGRAWISTFTDGFCHIDPEDSKVQWIIHERNNINSLLSDHVNVILEDGDGDLWYGTDNGVSLYQPATGKWRHFLNNMEDSPGHLCVVLALCEDAQKNVWAGGYGMGAFCISKQSGKVKRLKRKSEQENGIATNHIYTIYRDGDDLYFGGIEGELTRYNTTAESYSYYPVNCIGQIISGGENGKLLVACCNGLTVLDKQTGEATLHNTFGGLSLPNPIRSLARSSDGYIWLATDGNGLVRVNPAMDQAEVFTIDQGLNSNSVNSVFEDGSGNIWFNTEKNLYRFDADINKIVNVNDYFNIDWGYYNPNAFVLLKNGNLAVGTAEGALFFSPSFDYETADSIKLIFTDFKLSYRSVQAGEAGSLLKHAINETSAIRLSYSQNSFSIAFSAVNFVHSRNISYEYQLENFETEWLSSEPGSSVNYMNLPPGKYVFRLKATNRYSREVAGERFVEIIIGKPFWVSYWIFPVYLLVFFLLAYLVIQFARHRIEEYNSKEKIRSFISIAHDIRTPITLIKAPLSQLVVQTGLSDDIRKSLSIAVKNAEKLFDMVTQLLNLQKEELHPGRLTLDSQNVYAYMEEKVASFRAAAIQKELTMKLEIEPGFPELWLDKEKMDKILDNLLSNALKYTEEGSISVIVKQIKRKWTIEVLDTGIGIPSKDQKNLFTRFFRADNAVHSEKTGSGLGLLLVQRLVKQMHGQITFSSAEHTGSSFIVSLPLNICYSETTLEKESDVPAGIYEETETSALKNVLLLVEDNKDMQEYLTENLSKEYEVVYASDGGRALELAREINPDIIISDVVMPVLSGCEMCRILKSSIETSHIPIILLTALREREYVIAGLEAGANDYIVKPFDFSVLKIRIRNILQSRQHLRETVLSSDNTPEDVDYSSLLDKEFLDKTIFIINEELSNAEFSVFDFCKRLGMSRTSVYNKLKTLTGQSPNDFIRIVRLNKSKELLLSRRYSIGEVSFMVGFSDSKYFSTCFKKQYGISPSKI